MKIRALKPVGLCSVGASGRIRLWHCQKGTNLCLQLHLGPANANPLKHWASVKPLQSHLGFRKSRLHVATETCIKASFCIRNGEDKSFHLTPMNAVWHAFLGQLWKCWLKDYYFLFRVMLLLMITNQCKRTVWFWSLCRPFFHLCLFLFSELYGLPDNRLFGNGYTYHLVYPNHYITRVSNEIA